MPLFDLPLEQLRTFAPVRTEPNDFVSFWNQTLSETRSHPLEAKFMRVDYGLQSTGLLGGQLKSGGVVPAAIRRAHVLVTTKTFGSAVTPLAAELEKPVVVVNVRPAFVGEEWQAVVRGGRVYIVAADPSFLPTVHGHLRTTVDLANIKMLVAGRDDLGIIPPHAPTYVTEAARQKLGKTRVPGRLIPPTRWFAADSVRAIIPFNVSRNTSDKS